MARHNPLDDLSMVDILGLVKPAETTPEPEPAVTAPAAAEPAAATQGGDVASTQEPDTEARTEPAPTTAAVALAPAPSKRPVAEPKRIGRPRKEPMLPVATRLRLDVIEDLDRWCAKAGALKTDVFNAALRSYLDAQLSE